MEADAGLVLTPESVRGPDPEQGAQALAEFAALHGPALRASGVPERYWGRLLHKLEHEVRAGATQGGGRGAVLGPPPAQAGAQSAGPGRPGGGPLSTLLLGRARSAGRPLAENRWGAAAGRPGRVRLGKARRPPGGHVQMRVGGCPAPRGVSARFRAGNLCPAGQASVRHSGVCGSVARGVEGHVDEQAKWAEFR